MSQCNYAAEYGMTCAGMARDYGGTHQRYSYLHSVGRLHEFLRDPDNFNRQSGKKTTSKFLRLYGMTLTQMAAKYGRHPSWYHLLDAQDRLKGFMERPDSYLIGYNTQFSISYGRTMDDMGAELGVSTYTVSDLYHLGLLDLFIEKIKEKLSQTKKIS